MSNTRSNLHPFMRRLAAISLLTVVCQLPAQMSAKAETVIGDAVKELPLFDAHMHYKRPIWDKLPPDRVLAFMDRNGVAMALVSSSPDDGTITLWQHAPNRIVPEMRPYNDTLGPSNWISSPNVGDVIEQRVRQFAHEGIGEFHLNDIDPKNEALLKRIAALAVERQIPLHVHSDREPIEYLYQLNPELTIIWAHAGMIEPAAVVETMMARYASLYADTSYREIDIMDAQGEINPDWKQVLERFSDRFMVGSDTWNNNQWLRYDDLMDSNRLWLAQLTPATAHKIAYQNGARLFGKKISNDLLGKP